MPAQPSHVHMTHTQPSLSHSFYVNLTPHKNLGTPSWRTAIDDLFKDSLFFTNRWLESTSFNSYTKCRHVGQIINCCSSRWSSQICIYFGCLLCSRNCWVLFAKAFYKHKDTLSLSLSRFLSLFLSLSLCVCKISNKAFLPPLSSRLLCLVVAIPPVC